MNLKNWHHTLSQKVYIMKKMNAYTPQENGIAKWMNCTIVEMAWTFLQDASLPNTYWSFAVNYTTYVINWTPTRCYEFPSISRYAFPFHFSVHHMLLLFLYSLLASIFHSALLTFLSMTHLPHALYL